MCVSHFCSPLALAAQSSKSAREKRHGNPTKSFSSFLKRRKQATGGQEGARSKPLTLEAKTNISLRILDSSCERELSIICPDIEVSPPQCSVLGASHAITNGTYDMQGFQHGSPWYTNPNAVLLVREGPEGHSAWKFKHNATIVYVARCGHKPSKHQHTQSSKKEPPPVRMGCVRAGWALVWPDAPLASPLVLLLR